MVVSTRIVLSLLGVLGAIQAGLSLNLEDRYPASYAYPAFAVAVFLVFAVGWMVGGLVGKGLVRGFKRVERAVQSRSAGELTVAAIGLLVGLLVSALLWFPVHTLPYIGKWVILPLFLVVGYLFAFTAAKKHRGILRLVGVHPVAEPGTEPDLNGFVTLVDTSAIIDGRIADIVRTGFLKDELVVPEFVLRELQHVADSGDSLKRARGRRGLEVVQGLRSEVTLTTPDVDFPELDDVDAKLLKLAKARGLRILTTDFNLNRLAKIQDVVVLNVNELANALKPAVLPGESFDVRVIREGKEHDQGVGYLDDGTMVVVEGGRKLLGETAAVEVTSVLQSPSGKMIFTKVSSSTDAE
ncbi:MAG TPA: PIN domain-containing protein [Gaiellales bacterium]|nr:PIN domain-containing protein [Gaiellales bacterium]